MIRCETQIIVIGSQLAVVHRLLKTDNEKGLKTKASRRKLQYFERNNTNSRYNITCKQVPLTQTRKDLSM